MLNSPVLNATATESPVIISGVALKSIFPRLTGLNPKVSSPASLPVLNMPKKTSFTPSSIPLVDMLALVSPTNMIINVPTTIPISMEITAEMTLFVPSFAKNFCFPVSGSSLYI